MDKIKPFTNGVNLMPPPPLSNYSADSAKTDFGQEMCVFGEIYQRTTY